MKSVLALSVLAVASATSKVRFINAGNQAEISFDGNTNTLEVPGYVKQSDLATQMAAVNSRIDVLQATVDANTAKNGVTTQQAAAILANNAKVGITTQQAADINTNLAKTGITAEQATAIQTNLGKTGISSKQATDILTNNAKIGITATQASAIVTNCAKVGITVQQTADILANNAKVGITTQQAADINTNLAKTGITSKQATDITANNAKTGISAQQTDDINTNLAKMGITSAQATAITTNLAKVGITQSQADGIAANLAKVGITQSQADGIAANNNKVGITQSQADGIAANNNKVGITQSQADGIAANNNKAGITTQQAADIITNLAKVGLTQEQQTHLAAAMVTVMPSCLAWKNAGENVDGMYTINPTGTSEVSAWCDMNTDGGGWTLVFSGLGNSACRAQIKAGGSGAVGTPFTSSAVPNNILTLSNADINALGTVAFKQEALQAYSVGQSFKYISPSCTWHPQDNSMNSDSNCLSYALQYGQAETGSWSTGDMSQCGTVSCAPFGTNGGGNELNGNHERTGGQDNILSAGLFDSANCFDAWGFGQARASRIWAK